ncbi:hypothetical protein HPB50_027697 [Hyalomma asiaticum]|nr:hypothetical protein HPB50_027697 [Hyalomma asiaticum]
MDEAERRARRAAAARARPQDPAVRAREAAAKLVRRLADPETVHANDAAAQRFIKYANILCGSLSAPTSLAGVVRILNLKTGERLLIKGFRGEIRDMAFARLATTVMLAIVDEFGTLCVYEIHENNTTLLVKVDRPTDEVSSEYRRVVWCPYVPDDGARESRGKRIHIHTSNLIDLKPQTYDACKRTRLRILHTYTGYIRIYIHHQPVLGAEWPDSKPRRSKHVLLDCVGDDDGFVEEHHLLDQERSARLLMFATRRH